MMDTLIHFSFKKVDRGFEHLMTLQTWLELSGLKDLFVALLIWKWRRYVHVPCPAGGRHPSPGLSVALARSPVEYLSPAVHHTELWQMAFPSASLHRALWCSASHMEGPQCTALWVNACHTMLQSAGDGESRHVNFKFPNLSTFFPVHCCCV